MTPTTEEMGANIHLSSEISRFFVTAMIAPADLIRLLNASGIDYVLTGAYATNVWTGKPRATLDVDVLVGAPDHPRAIGVIREAYPGLEIQDTGVVTRFRDPSTGQVVLDFMKPSAPIFEAVFGSSCEALVGGQPVRVPVVEMAAALKFAAMIGPWRELDKKYIDAGDFIAIVRTHPELDLERLARLGDLVYPGGAGEILRIAEDAREGRKLVF